MLDESIAHSRPSEWNRVIELETELVNLIGSPKFDHVLPNPVEGLTSIFHDLRGKQFTAIMDLTGWLLPSLRYLFPDTPIIEGFSLSRVRVVSSPNLETSGYTVSMSPEQITDTSRTLNLDRTLIVDDTTFTGWTSLKTAELWGLHPEMTTYSFLIANTGMLDPENDIRGAVRELQSRGSSVVWGHGLATPAEDGWHLKDLHQHTNLIPAFEMGLMLLQSIETEGPNSQPVKEILDRKDVMDTIFPDRLSSDEIKQMTAEGKFIPSGKVNLDAPGLIHTKNPLLWASRYFREHIDLEATIKNKGAIAKILYKLRYLTEDPEARSEAALELRNIARINTQGPEGQTGFNKER